MQIRSIKTDDNPFIAKIIRACLEEFGANKPGTVYFDETTDHLFELFQTPGSAYFIAEQDGALWGGGGIFPSEGLPDGTCELVKMYLLPHARGNGNGAALMNMCIEKARAMGYEKIYIETMPELKRAIYVYEKFGFEYLNGPMGNTGHHGCDIWMCKQL